MTLRFGIVLLAIFCLGCNSRPYEVVPVSGHITINGEPLANASVTTQPIAQGDSIYPGPGSFGKTDEQGRFSLELVDPEEPGAVVGKHRLMITQAGFSERPESDLITDVPVDTLPPKCRDGSLTIEVPREGHDDLHIELDFSRR